LTTKVKIKSRISEAEKKFRRTEENTWIAHERKKYILKDQRTEFTG
jgi:hypothetical protein